MATAVPMYQGEDFSQQLSYFTDIEQTVPLVFADPVMDVRDLDGNLLARFDLSGTELGLITITSPGVIVMTMDHADTETLAAGTYPIDVFADVDTGGGVIHRMAITKRGVLKLKISARITRDPVP